ncbi:PAS domain-containing protein, partial [Streptomyces europaeiscabiei]
MRVGTSSTRRALDVLATSAARHDDLAELGIAPDDLPDGLVVADENGRVICFNAAAARITATPAADALGRPLE